MDAGRELWIGGQALDRGEQRRGLVLGQPRERDPLHPAGPLQLGEPRQRRMPAVQLVGAQRHGDQDLIRAQGPDQEPERLAGGGIGPVDVLDDDQHRRDLGQAPEHADERVEQPRLEPDLLRLRSGRSRLDRRHEARQVGTRRPDDRLEPHGVGVPDQLAKDLDDRAVRQSLVADVGARAAEDDHPASLGRGRQLPDEPGLADAGFTRDEQVRGRPADRGVQREDPRLELGGAADGDGADEASGHPSIIRNEGTVPDGSKDRVRLRHSAVARWNGGAPRDQRSARSASSCAT